MLAGFGADSSHAKRQLANMSSDDERTPSPKTHKATVLAATAAVTTPVEYNPSTNVPHLMELAIFNSLAANLAKTGLNRSNLLMLFLMTSVPQIRNILETVVKDILNAIKTHYGKLLTKTMNVISRTRMYKLVETVCHRLLSRIFFAAPDKDDTDQVEETTDLAEDETSNHLSQRIKVDFSDNLQMMGLLIKYISTHPECTIVKKNKEIYFTGVYERSFTVVITKMEIVIHPDNNFGIITDVPIRIFSDQEVELVYRQMLKSSAAGSDIAREVSRDVGTGVGDETRRVTGGLDDSRELTGTSIANMPEISAVEINNSDVVSLFHSLMFSKFVKYHSRKYIRQVKVYTMEEHETKDKDDMTVSFILYCLRKIKPELAETVDNVAQLYVVFKLDGWARFEVEPDTIKLIRSGDSISLDKKGWSSYKKTTWYVRTILTYRKGPVVGDTDTHLQKEFDLYTEECPPLYFNVESANPKHKLDEICVSVMNQIVDVNSLSTDSDAVSVYMVKLEETKTTKMVPNPKYHASRGDADDTGAGVGTAIIKSTEGKRDKGNKGDKRDKGDKDNKGDKLSDNKIKNDPVQGTAANDGDDSSDDDSDSSSESDHVETKNKKKNKGNGKRGYGLDHRFADYYGGGGSHSLFNPYLMRPAEPKEIEVTESTFSVKCQKVNEVTKHFNTLYLPKKDMYVLGQYLETFKNSSKIYKEFCIRRKLGILLHGLPGTGKSSTIQAIATFLGYDIYYVSLNGVKTNAQLKMIFDNILENKVKKGMIIFEEIDTQTNIVHRRIVTRTNSLTEQDGSELSSKLSDSPSTVTSSTNSGETVEHTMYNLLNAQDDALDLGYLLNVLDGTLSTEGMVVCLTTNHIDRLDPALYRPGRIDIKIDMKLCDHYQIESIYRKIMGCDISTTTLAKIPVYRYTPSEIIHHCLRMRPLVTVQTDEEIMEEYTGGRS